MSRTVLLSLPIACLLAGPALAADPTPERAAAAEDAIRDFMKDLLGPTLRIGDKPIHLQPGGDGYDASATVSPGQQITARVKEGAAGVWTFDTLRYPLPLHFTVDLPSPTPNAPDTHVTYDIKAAEQDGSGTIDTTLATPSSASSTARALDLTSTGPDQSSTSHVGRATGNSGLRPGSAPGTVDLTTGSTMTDYSIVANAQTPELNLNLRLDMAGADVKADVSGLVPDRGKAMVRQAIALISANRAQAQAQKAAGATDKPPFDLAAAREFVRTLDGVATAASIDESVTKLNGVANGFAFNVEQARFGLDGASPDGKLNMGLRLEVAGLTLPAVAGTPMAAFIPSKVTIRPTVTGLNTHDLLGALITATDPARPADAPAPPEFMALVTAPGVAAGIESMEVDLGRSVLTGTGQVNMATPGRVAGTGRITATQFDSLTDLVKTLPQANQALPVMLFAKGIGRTEGERLVWDINYDGAKLLVNGVDVMAMANGGGNRPPATTPAPTPAPQQPQQQRPTNRR